MMFRTSVGFILKTAIVCGFILLLVGFSTPALAQDDYVTYYEFPFGGAYCAGSWVEDYGTPSWGDEIQYVYFVSGSTGYKYRVWITNEGSASDPTSYIEVRQHPGHPNPLYVGPIEPRHFEFVSSGSLSDYFVVSDNDEDEFHIDSRGIFLGSNNGIHHWDHDWNYIGQIAPVSPGSPNTETLAYNPEDNTWYTGGRWRDMYEINDTDSDGDFMDETWVHIFTYTTMAGGHHDGLEYVSGYLWVSDMTSDVLAKWEYDGSSWSEIGRYTYTHPEYVEGMGFGANGHFWVTSGDIVYELGDDITIGEPIADAGDNVPPYPSNYPLEFDGSGSYHMDPAREIVLYEWDFDGDGTYDWSGTVTVTEHSYPAIGTYTACLRVTDDNVPPKTDVDCRIVNITNPPYAPVADPNGPYNAPANVTVCLDGSGSFHPAQSLFSPGHPWYDEIALWEWDLDNDGQFDDASGEIICLSWPAEGTYIVGLRVTDLNWVGGTPGPLDVDEKYTTVIIAIEIHDVAVTALTPELTDIPSGTEIDVDVTVANIGSFSETFDVTLYYDDTVIDVINVPNLGTSSETDLVFTWNTTGLSEGPYTLKAEAEPVDGEYNITDNVMETVVTISNGGCGPTNLLLVGYRDVDWTPPHWEVQVEVRNNGPYAASDITVTMNSDIPWLVIPDPNCAYGDLAVGASSWGLDSYVFDLTAHPGGSFNVWFDVTYMDACGNPHCLRLDPEFNSERTEATPALAYQLGQNYPNPFNPNTMIDFQILSTSEVSLRVYDVSGQLVRTLVEGSKNEGHHTVQWDGRDNSGLTVTSGIYFYRLIAGDFVQTKKMVLLR